MSAALAGVGYLLQAARDHFLGIQLRADLTVADYGLIGGRFFVEVITLVLQTLGLHPVVAPVAVLATGALFYLLVRRARYALGFVGIVTRLMVIVLLLIGKAAVFDVPTALIDDVLIERADPNRDFDASPLLNWSTNLLWRQILCAHAPDGSPQKESGDAKLAQHRLDTLFLANLLVTLVLATWTGAVVKQAAGNPPADPVRANTLRIGMGAAVLSLAITLLALPYQYGKLVEPTRFNEVELYFRDTERKPSASPLPATSAPATPATTTTATQPPAPADDEDEHDLLGGSSLLLASDKDILTLYVERDDVVRQVSRDQIESVKVHPPRDVLSLHIAYSMKKAGS